MLDIAADKKSAIDNDSSKFQINVYHATFGVTSLNSTDKDNGKDNNIEMKSNFSRPEIKGHYDHQFYNELLRQSKRFGRLRRDVVLDFLEERGKYRYLKKFAVERLYEKIANELEILQRMYKCEKYVKDPDEKLSHNIFSWSMRDFLKRRNLHDFVWIDVVQRISENCLMIYKFKQDVKQLKEFLRIIFDGLYTRMGFEDVDIKQSIVNPISDAKKVLDISKTIDQDLQDHNRLFWELSQKDTFMANIKRESADKMMKIFMETRLMNSHIWNPIELRYQLAWYTSKVNQMKYRIESTHESRQKYITKMQQKTTIETRVNASCMDFYYTAIEDTKSRLTRMQTKFDSEYETIENRISYKKSRIEKLSDEWKFRKEEIQRFHEEIDIMLRRQELEAEKLEWKRLEEEALALTEQKRKSKVVKEVKAKEPLKPGSPKRLVRAHKVVKEVKSKGPVKSNVSVKSINPKKTVTAGKNKK